MTLLEQRPHASCLITYNGCDLVFHGDGDPHAFSHNSLLSDLNAFNYLTSLHMYRGTDGASVWK